MDDSLLIENDIAAPQEVSVGSAPDDWELVDPGRIVPDGSARDSASLRSWELVLSSMGIDHRLDFGKDGSHLWVRKADRRDVIRELKLYEAENHNWPPQPAAARPSSDNGLISVSVLMALAIFHNLTLLAENIDWVALGSASSRKILGGEWWRLLTALTLHSDGIHVASNILIGSAFVLFFCREVGTGLGWCLILLSGILGNVLNVLVQPLDHNAIGASTALFGCIGLLTGISLPHSRPKLGPRRIFSLAAGFVLLAMLGTGDQRTDVGAHLFGFVSGGFLGFSCGVRLGAERRLTPVVDGWLCLLAFLAPLAAWGMALLSTPSP